MKSTTEPERSPWLNINNIMQLVANLGSIFSGCGHGISASRWLNYCTNVTSDKNKCYSSASGKKLGFWVIN